MVDLGYSGGNRWLDWVGGYINCLGNEKEKGEGVKKVIFMLVILAVLNIFVFKISVLKAILCPILFFIGISLINDWFLNGITGGEYRKWRKKMKKSIFILALLFFSSCSPNIVFVKDVRSDGQVIFSHTQDPSTGVLIQAGNTRLDIEIFKETNVKKEGNDWYRESKLLYQVVLQPASLGRSLEMRGNKAVWVSDTWLKLEPGIYTLIVYPSRGIGVFKRQFPRQTFTLEVDNDPSDYLYSGRYVGWVQRFDISENAGLPGLEIRIN